MSKKPLFVYQTAIRWDSVDAQSKAAEESLNFDTLLLKIRGNMTF
jgi:hypothetical protein